MFPKDAKKPMNPIIEDVMLKKFKEIRSKIPLSKGY